MQMTGTGTGPFHFSPVRLLRDVWGATPVGARPSYFLRTCVVETLKGVALRSGGQDARSRGPFESGTRMSW